ncbi:YhgE/Pip family protein [Lacticaseibacillus suihuaensis]
MIKDEFGFIKRNKLILLSVTVIMIIPFLYSIFFLKSVWDPYGDTQDLPVAVVNNDRAVTYNGTKLNVGEQTVKKLRKNKQLGWHFVSAKQAAKGLRNNKYYTVVTIPSNFSKNAATVLDANPKKMRLTYQTNDSLNYLSSVISGIGVDKLDKEIRANVTNAYASAVFDQIKTVGSGMHKAAKGATQLSDGLATLDDGVSQYVVGVSKVNDGVQTLSVKVKPLSSGVNQLATGAKTLNAGLDQYVTGADTLAAGINTLAGKVGPLAAGTQKLASGANTLAGGTKQLNAKVGPLATGTKKLADGAKTLNTGIGDYTDGVSQVAKGVSAMKTQTAALDAASLKKLADGSATLNSSTGEYVAGVTTLSDNLTKLNAAAQTLPSNMKTLQGNIDKMAAGVTKIKAEVTATSALAKTKATKVVIDYATAKAQLTAAGVAKDSTAAQSLDKMYADFMDFATTQQKATGTAADTADTATLMGGLTQLEEGAKALSAALDTQLTSTGDITKLASSLTQLQAGAKVLATKGTALTQGSATLNASVAQLTAGLPALLDGIDQLDQGVGLVTANSLKLKLGAATLTGGLNTMNGQIPALTSGVSQLNGGAQQLAGGLNTMNGQIPALTSGISQLNNGGQQLAANGGKLTAGSKQLASGLGQMQAQLPQLTEGVTQLASGTKQLDDKSKDLTSGTGKLGDGAKTLSTSLGAGAKQVNGIKLSDKTAKMFAAPTKLHHGYYSKVDNYGHALAPYVLSLALYVGALVFNFAYPIRKVSKKDGTATQWFASKIVLGGLVATGMALVEATLIIAAGLTVDHVGLFYLFAELFALASMYLVMFLSMWLDNPGRFVAMVLLMLQLGGAGGTFPLEITNHFYNVIHPFLPMSYSIMGFRQAITSGIASGTVAQAVVVLIGVALGSLALLWLVMQHLQKKHLMGVSQLDDNQKLQEVEK